MLTLMLTLHIQGIGTTEESASPPLPNVDYDRLERDLHDSNSASKSFLELKQGKDSIAMIARDGREPLFRDMAALDPNVYPRLVGFGLKAIADRDSTAAYLIGIRAYARIRDPIAISIEELNEIVLSKHDDEARKQALTLMADLPFDVDLLRSTVIARFSIELMYDWWRVHANATKLPRFAALLLEKLFDNCADNALAITDEMRKGVESLRDVPGYPRIVYARFANDSDAFFRVILEQVLADPKIDEVVVASIVDSRCEFIRNNVDISRLPATKERQERIAELLQRNR